MHMNGIGNGNSLVKKNLLQKTAFGVLEEQVNQNYNICGSQMKSSELMM